jgi:glycosyltransferase involved in cell wall biosynthesis
VEVVVVLPETNTRPRLAVVSTYPPRRCGLASFTADLVVALRSAAPDLDIGIAAVDRDDLPYGSDVVAVIDQDSEPSYRHVARRLARDELSAVLIQHEYGIFGGEHGAYVLALADELSAQGVPYLVTLHTVLSQPSPGQGTTLRQLCAGAARVTTFSETARRLATRTGVADEDKVVVIQHGAPLALLTANDPVPLLQELVQLTNAGRIVTTFGLISAGKGIDTAIEAIAQVVNVHPDVIYVVVGQTHPEVVRREGEAYRARLVALVECLGMGEHVRFIDAFLTEHELGALLRRTTIFLTPYRSPEQTCSGALTFALAAGRPVVSTSYSYAEDMLAGGAGPVVACQDPAAMAAALDTLLADPTALARAEAAAWAVGSRLSWPAVAARVADLVRDVTTRRLQAPPLNLGHLRRLTDELGIIQFAHGVQPDPSSGYCVDDVARLGIVAADLAALGYEPRLAADWIRLVLRFLAAALRDGAGMHNRLTYEGTWADEPHVGDHVGRAIWAAAAIADSPGVSDELRERAAALVEDLAVLSGQLADSGLRALGYAILGLSRVPAASRPGEMSDLLHRLDATWRASATADWYWPEDCLTYDNARLVEAMLRASDKLSEPEIAARALVSLEWYLAEVNLDAGVLRCVGNRWRHRDQKVGSPPDRDFSTEGDEQPIDVAALVEVLLTAWRHTGDERYATLALRAFAWFLGHNRLDRWIYNPDTGGCHDGLSIHWTNRNQGAESTLAYHQAVLALARAGLVSIDPADPHPSTHRDDSGFDRARARVNAVFDRARTATSAHKRASSAARSQRGKRSSRPTV